MRLISVLEAGLGTCASLYFIYAALYIMTKYEKEMCISSYDQILSLSGMTLIAGCLLFAVSEASFYPNMCSLAFLTVVAAVDAQTGYVYNCFGYWAVIFTGALALQKGTVSHREGSMILLYLSAVIAAAALKGLGSGDVPVYFALLFYYIRYTAFPGDCALFMLLGSQMLFGLAALVKRKKRLPLVPYIGMAHMITICIWT